MRALLPCLLLFLLTACAGRPPAAPEGVRQAERYTGLGVQAFNNDDYPGATAMFAKAQAVYRSLDHMEGMVQSGINLAETAIAIGSYPRALRQVEAVEPLALRLGKPGYAPRLALLAATALAGMSERDRALARLQPLLPAFDADGAPRLAPAPEALAALVLRTRIAFLGGDPEAARWTRRLERSLERAGEADALVRARLLRFQSDLARQEGDRAAARARLDQALALYHSKASRAGAAATLDQMARLALAEGQLQEAREGLERALFIRLWILDRTGAGDSLQALSEVYAALGVTERAVQARQWAASLEAEGEPDWKRLREQWVPAE